MYVKYNKDKKREKSNFISVFLILSSIIGKKESTQAVFM